MHIIQNSKPRDVVVKIKSLSLLNICTIEKMGYFLFLSRGF